MFVQNAMGITSRPAHLPVPAQCRKIGLRTDGPSSQWTGNASIPQAAMLSMRRNTAWSQLNYLSCRTVTCQRSVCKVPSIE